MERRELWTLGLLRRRTSQIKVSCAGTEEVAQGGSEMAGRWWKIMESKETEAIYEAVSSALYGGVVMRMWMDIEFGGRVVSMSLPSSTMVTKWPIAGDGYKTIASIDTLEYFSGELGLTFHI